MSTDLKRTVCYPRALIALLFGVAAAHRAAPVTLRLQVSLSPPELVFYNKAMFGAGGLAYPTDNWTFEERRQAAIQLTLGAHGRHPTAPDFDPDTIAQWGWNGSLNHLWRRHALQALGADWCVNDDRTVLDMTSPKVVAAASWWASLVQEEHAGLHDPYGGSQTGTPGDPFVAGKAAMGFNGYFAVGQLNASGAIAYDIVQPFLAQNGNRYAVLSTNGYVISAASQHPAEAWALVQALLEADFLAQVWGREGHFVPARKSAAESVLESAEPPANRQAILDAMAYGEVFKPYTSSAFEAYAQTLDLFAQAMRGDLSVAEALEQIETVANGILAQDRDGDMTGGDGTTGKAAQKLQSWVDHAGDSTSVKPSLIAFWRRAAISRSRARCSSSAALRSRNGVR